MLVIKENVNDPSEKKVTRLAEHLGWKVRVQILIFYL